MKQAEMTVTAIAGHCIKSNPNCLLTRLVCDETHSGQGRRTHRLGELDLVNGDFVAMKHTERLLKEHTFISKFYNNHQSIP
ncbi:hypothetical protein [Pseudomonas fluorescens]|nr:hypothetical protein [Pseudomonas fluorescens]